MRELTKSIGSFVLAMSSFGAQQMTNIARQPVPGTDHPASADLESVARSTEERLEGYFRGTYEAGDRLQRSAVDFMFGLMSPQALNPGKLMAMSSDLMRQSASAMIGLIPGQNSSTGKCQEPCGWGPMPPVK